MCSARCEPYTTPPMSLRCLVISVSRGSEPVTRYPRLMSTSAIPHMPMPPMPTK